MLHNGLVSIPFDKDGALLQDVCEEAWRGRDPDYDGVFFICVRTTKVYCRPICRVKFPHRKNIEFVPTAAAAERLGFRPCLRCRPESAPGSPAWKGTGAVVGRGIKIIEDGYLDTHSTEELATRLGLSVRHMNRLFRQHAAATPYQIGITWRRQQAKRLISDTELPLTKVAHAAGFKSVRRFNEVIAESYGRTPTQIRRKATAGVS